ncbi:uncharacterized protein LOC133124462 [Conger conger]|uniref:uncharacterized protein LOC133124462 n=1 Tax=Conger conger TaxID=82655 RepID=UPI002A5AE7EB|nr:uncharacterized protein LOC133124462 [Conger conger]
MAPHTLLLLLALVTGTSCSRFTGGLMGYYPKGRDMHGNYQVDLRFKDSFLGSCRLQNPWSCYTGDCGTVASTQISTVFSGTEACQNEGILTLNVTTNKPFEMHYSSCCWVGNEETNSGRWNLVSHVDLGIRSDTRAPNRSPLMTILPVISLAKNCPATIKLLSHDQDGDRVRCRFENNGSCSVCASHAQFHLDEETCELHYRGNAATGTHVFEIAVEDFPRKNIWLSYSDGTQKVKHPLPSTPSSSVTPISKIPLQFVIKVKPSLQNCTAGLLLPALVDPSPQYGDILNAAVDKPLEIHIAAQAQQSKLTDIVVTGPLRIFNIFDIESGEMITKWAPTDRDVGDHFPVCFSAESQSGDHVYHSAMRCVIVRVVPKMGEATVVCNEKTMTIAVERSLVHGLNGTSLSLLDPSCTVSSNNTHVFAITPLDGCGTLTNGTGENVTFSNELKKIEKAGSIMTRTEDVEIEFSCTYCKKGGVSTYFKARKLGMMYAEDGFGKFSFEFQFFHSQHYEINVDPSTYPIEVRLKEMIYMEIKSKSSLQNTVLFVESCKATPEDGPNHATFYSIIDNGCNMDKTLQVYPSQSNEFRFGMQAFKFIGMHTEVYISCSVMLCLAGDPNTRCAQGCISQSHVAKRSVPGQTVSHDIMQGPLRLKRSLYDEGLRVLNAPIVYINTNVLAVTFLAAVALVCAVLVYKIKKSSVGYKQLPSPNIEAVNTDMSE